MKINNNNYNRKTVKNIENESHGSRYNKASSNLLVAKTYWIVALFSVLVSTLDA